MQTRFVVNADLTGYLKLLQLLFIPHYIFYWSRLAPKNIYYTLKSWSTPISLILFLTLFTLSKTNPFGEWTGVLREAKKCLLKFFLCHSAFVHDNGNVALMGTVNADESHLKCKFYIRTKNLITIWVALLFPIESLKFIWLIRLEGIKGLVYNK